MIQLINRREGAKAQRLSLSARSPFDRLCQQVGLTPMKGRLSVATLKRRTSFFQGQLVGPLSEPGSQVRDSFGGCG